MCLLIHNKNENSGVPKKARKPIKVYKMLVNLSPIPGEEVYATACRYEPVKFVNDGAILHTDKIGEAKVWKGGDNLLFIEKGIHAYTERKMAEYVAKNIGAQVFEAVIPKGAMYVRGIGREIVTDYLYIYEGK